MLRSVYVSSNQVCVYWMVLIEMCQQTILTPKLTIFGRVCSVFRSDKMKKLRKNNLLHRTNSGITYAATNGCVCAMRLSNVKCAV